METLPAQPLRSTLQRFFQPSWLLRTQGPDVELISRDMNLNELEHLSVPSTKGDCKVSHHSKCLTTCWVVQFRYHLNAVDTFPIGITIICID